MKQAVKQRFRNGLRIWEWCGVFEFLQTVIPRGDRLSLLISGQAQPLGHLRSFCAGGLYFRAVNWIGMGVLVSGGLQQLKHRMGQPQSSER